MYLREVSGCTNSTANNFDPLATDEDGSCDYTQTVICTEDLCWDGSSRDPTDCSCPPEDTDSDSKLEVVEEAESSYPWILLIILLILIISFIIRSNRKQ